MLARNFTRPFSLSVFRSRRDPNHIYGISVSQNGSVFVGKRLYCLHNYPSQSIMMTPQLLGTSGRILPSMDPENRLYATLLAGHHRYLLAGERAGRPMGQSGTGKGEIDGRPVNYD